VNSEPWQFRLVKRSLKKKIKLRLLDRHLRADDSRVALDLGCAQGILSYFVRRKGGFWVSADEDLANVRTAREILRDDLVTLSGTALPFRDGSFDLVVGLDYLEHVEDDGRVLEEISRVLKKGGELVLVTPQTGPFFILHKLRAALGLRLEHFGHKREGYALATLDRMLSRVSLRLVASSDYSRFFSEFFELLLNFAYVKILAPAAAGKVRDGHIRPASEGEFSAQAGLFGGYSLVYPLVWLLSQLDRLLFFEKGYSVMVRAIKQGVGELGNRAASGDISADPRRRDEENRVFCYNSADGCLYRRRGGSGAQGRGSRHPS
jgi:SAM-dependent methyltransferase